jgi:hypothetical protein
VLNPSRARSILLMMDKLKGRSRRAISVYYLTSSYKSRPFGHVLKFDQALFKNVTKVGAIIESILVL